MIKTVVLDSVIEAATMLREGKLVAFPTETVYGLGARLFDEEGIRSVFQAKGRPSDNPLIVHVSSLLQVEAIAQEIPSIFYRLAQLFWPGPLTVVLKKQPHVSLLVSGGLDSIAIRMPSHPMALELINQVGAPLVAPSANLSGRPSPTQASHVLEDLEGSIAAVLDGGECPLGVESTVISLLEDEIVILRPGSIGKEELEKVLERAISFASEKTPLRSPGMKYRHYAPSSPLQLVETQGEITSALDRWEGKKMVLASDPIPSSSGYDSFVLSSHNLYALLRQADREGYVGIVVLCDSALRRDEALVNRLLKASNS